MAGFLPQIEAAAANRERVAGAWARVREAAQEAGVALPPGGIQEMNRLYSRAAGVRNAGEAFSAADPASVITERMVAPAAFAVPGAGTGEERAWLVRFEANTGTPDNPDMQWLTWAHQGPLPPTVGELQDTLSLYGNRITETPTGPVIGVGTVQIMAV